MVNFEMKSHYDYEDLLQVVHILRSPGGCPWDQEQTHRSIRRDFLEEAYEAAEAIDTGDTALLREELGDVLLQVVFHADIESDAGRFTMADVVDEVTKKMIFRHPHVFGEVQADTTEQVLVNWDQLKQEEKAQKTATDTLDSVARTLPGLWRAEKVQKKAAKAGFDWADISGALEKLDEETAELRAAVMGEGDVEEELGDVLFAAVKVARFAGVDPEGAIGNTCEKFIRRFRAVENAVRERGADMKDLPLEELTALWEQAKQG
ncbi:MAG: nucleoside triphosphate pyrophosphohydrolase [Oscillospiraceae bacterium]|nr:nucleoside triphosphate pyrophosphohydrolase [Oscillospiraceae bacterium]